MAPFTYTKFRVYFKRASTTDSGIRQHPKLSPDHDINPFNYAMLVHSPEISDLQHTSGMDRDSRLNSDTPSKANQTPLNQSLPVYLNPIFQDQFFRPDTDPARQTEALFSLHSDGYIGSDLRSITFNDYIRSKPDILP